MFLTTLLLAAALQGRQPVTEIPGSETSPATAEGIEILRRVLADAIDQAFDEKKDGQKVTVRKRGNYDDVHGLVTDLWTGDRTIEHSRAFHLPDVGLFFSLDAALPVVDREEEEPEPTSDRPTDDEWERARREVRGGRRNDVLFWRVDGAEGAGRVAEIDPAAIERVIDLVLKTLARHTGRIEGLGSRETVTIGLRLHGRRGNWLQGFGGQNGFFPLELDPFDDEDDGGKDEELDEDRSSKAQSYSYVLRSGGEAREQNLVIRIAVSDLLGSPDGDARTLRQRALINRYSR